MYATLFSRFLVYNNNHGLYRRSQLVDHKNNILYGYDLITSVYYLRSSHSISEVSKEYDIRNFELGPWGHYGENVKPVIYKCIPRHLH